MKVAFMIMAHNQPDHLEKIIRKLGAPWATLFIHIDKKAEISAFRAITERYSNVCLLPDNERVKVYWGGFSQVKATLAMLARAFSDPRHFDRFVLLSGVDYPIKKVSEIYQILNRPLEYIRIDREVMNPEHDYSRFVDHYHFFDFPFRKLIRKLRIPKPVYSKIPLYHGSSWWGLSRAAVEFVFDYTESNPDYLKAFRFTRSADEIFFHTLIKASPFSRNIAQDFERQADLGSYLKSNEHALTYIDWHVKNYGLPKVLQEEDLQALMESPCAFARKFSEVHSSGVLKLIDDSLSG